MAFKPHTNDNGNPLPLEYLPATAGETYAMGEALKLAGGAVTMCAGATAPEYICATKKASATAEDLIGCYRVDPAVVWGVPLSAAGTALTIGAKVTIGTDGLTLTATTTSGVAEIMAMDGTAVGDRVYCRF